MSIFVQNMLDISTGHLTKETRQRMGEDSRNFFVGKPCSLPFSVKGSSFGWFIDVRDADERAASGLLYPFDIVDSYELALSVGCSYILFDRDAERHAALNWYGDKAQAAYIEPQEPPGVNRVSGNVPTLNEIKSLFNQ
ncbi:MAG: hypothetical protein L3J37_12215 [Rhodobacteraceae bacterium]|nr:hypothetical protein [Paracoccaceae bacterium]